MADFITIRAYADGSTLIGSQIVSAGAGFSISVDSSTLSVGSHAISVTAQDTTQSYAESAQVSAGSISVSAAGGGLSLGTPVYTDAPTTSSTTVAATVSFAAGTTILVALAGDMFLGSQSVASSPPLTWTAFAPGGDGTYGGGQVRWFWAYSAGAYSGTITATATEGGRWMLSVLPVTGANTTAPIGAISAGFYPDNSYVTPTTSLTGTVAGSLLLYLGQDRDGTVQSAGSGLTSLHTLAMNSAATFAWLFRYTGAGPGGSVTMSASASTNAYAYAAIEVLKA